MWCTISFYLLFLLNRFIFAFSPHVCTFPLFLLPDIITFLSELKQKSSDKTFCLWSKEYIWQKMASSSSGRSLPDYSSSPAPVRRTQDGQQVKNVFIFWRKVAVLTGLAINLLQYLSKIDTLLFAHV